jgi:hypothetical protein
MFLTDTVRFLAALLILAPAALAAQPADRGKDVLVRVNGLARVAAGETVSTAVAVGDRALIEGTVLDQLVVVNGSAHVTGNVAGDVVAVNSQLDLAPGASIAGDVRLVRSQLVAAPDATIAGSIIETTGFGIPTAVLWALFIGITVIVLALGALLAGLAGRQLSEAADIAISRPGATALTAAITAFGLPAVGIAAMASIIGIPVGIAILALLIPALWFAGYVVAGAVIGGLILRGRGRAERPDRPYRSVLLGLVIFQLLWLLPFLGGLIVVLAGFWCAGALLYRSWLRRRGEPPQREEELRAAA